MVDNPQEKVQAAVIELSVQWVRVGQHRRLIFWLALVYFWGCFLMSASFLSWLRCFKLIRRGLIFDVAGVLVGLVTGKKQPSNLLLLSKRLGDLIFSDLYRFRLQFLPVEIISVRVRNLIDLRPIACTLKKDFVFNRALIKTYECVLARARCRI